MRMQNSPDKPEIERPKRADRWTRVSAEDIDVYTPWDTPIKASKSASKILSLGRSRTHTIAIALEGEMAGGSDDQNEVTVMMDEVVVKAAQRAAATSTRNEWRRRCWLWRRCMCYSSRSRRNNLPVSSWPPTNRAKRPYGVVRRSRLKIERINVSQTHYSEMTYLAHAQLATPLGDASSQACGGVGPRGRHRRLKTRPTSVILAHKGLHT